jgi:hypothetical protein
MIATFHRTVIDRYHLRLADRHGVQTGAGSRK